MTLTLPNEWEADVREWPIQLGAGEAFRLPVYIKLPQNARLGTQMTILDFDIVSDRPRRFRVYRPYQVGTDDVTIQIVENELPDGGLEIEQIVINRTSPPEILDFRCTLFVKGDRRQKLLVTKLGQGEDHKFYRLSSAQAVRGKTLWLRLEQDGGRRILNYQWAIGDSANDSKTGGS